MTRRTLLWLICLPVIAGVVRKGTPGQPSWIEALPTLCLLPALLAAYRKHERLPTVIVVGMAGLLSLQLVYVIPSFYENVTLGLSVVMTRLAPMLLAPLAFWLLRDREDINAVSAVGASVCLISGAVMLAGETMPSSAMGWISQPLNLVQEAGKDSRLGIRAFTGLFTTPWLAALSAVGCVYFALLHEESAGKKKRQLILLLGVASGLLGCFLSTRRAAFLMACFLIMAGLVVSRTRTKWRTMVMAAGLVAIVIGSNHIGVLGKRSYEYTSRIEFMRDRPFERRFDEVFIKHTRFWVNSNPLGSYLGFAGPEGRALGHGPGIREPVVEVGAALLAAEMGFMGLILWPVSLVIVWAVAGGRLRLANHGERSIIVLSVLFQIAYFGLFYFKELLALANVSLGQFAFWMSMGILARGLAGFDRGGKARHTARIPGRSACWLGRPASGIYRQGEQ